MNGQTFSPNPRKRGKSQHRTTPSPRCSGNDPFIIDALTFRTSPPCSDLSTRVCNAASPIRTLTPSCKRPQKTNPFGWNTILLCMRRNISQEKIRIWHWGKLKPIQNIAQWPCSITSIYKYIKEKYGGTIMHTNEQRKQEIITQRQTGRQTELCMLVTRKMSL